MIMKRPLVGRGGIVITFLQFQIYNGRAIRIVVQLHKRLLFMFDH